MLIQFMDSTKPEYPIYNNRQWGPCFGDHIQLSDKCNTNSSLQFPYHYNFTAKLYNQKE